MKKAIHNVFFCIEIVLIAIIYLIFAKEHVHFTPYVTYPLAIILALLPIGLLAAVAFVVCSFFYNIHPDIVTLSYVFIVVYLLGIFITSLFKK
ncbi:MAG: hypothetical protein IKO48_03390 [Elusimicrobia bacterium]|nr:hypothetical protein [Elusimicrobiota bacterium]